ncbi:MAG: hypothetical protein SNJ64_06725, partial [Endomicrobiia bacterium]
MDEQIRHIRPLYQLLRSFIYTSIIACILVILTIIDFIQSTASYEMLAFAILVVLLIEGYFTVKYLKSNDDSAINYHLSDHLINHFFYPSLSLFGLIFYLILENNKLFSFIIIFISSILFFLYFYYLPFHIYYDHIDHPKHKKIFPRIDFVLYIFKFFTYFVTNLTIFTYYFNSLVSQQFVIITNFFVNFVFLFFHIFRKDLLSKMNIFMAIVFAFFVSLFVLA